MNLYLHANFLEADNAMTNGDCYGCSTDEIERYDFYFTSPGQ